MNFRYSWEVKIFCGNSHFLLSNTYFRGTVMSVHYGFIFDADYCLREFVCVCECSWKWAKRMHYKEPIPKIRNKNSQKRNCAASVQISRFMCLRAIYVCIPTIDLSFLLQDQSLEYIKIAHRHMNWKLELWPSSSFSGNICFQFVGLHKLKFLCSVEEGRRRAGTCS